MDGINYIIELIKNNNDELFSKAYAFTTENISGYYNKLEFNSKSILTVTASGDQAINALLYGSKEIDCFDSNPLAKYVLELKIAAIKSLNRDEYLNFFCDGKDSLNIETYSKVKKYLSDDFLFFWDSVYNEFIPEKIREIIFNKDEHSRDKIILFNPYLQNFNLIKLKINDIKINYLTCNIIDLHKYLNKKYDTVILSNIMQYAECIYEKDSLINFKNMLLKLTEFVKDNGKIMCGYLYYFDFNNYEYETKKEVFTPKEYEYFQIDGIREENDGIILFNK